MADAPATPALATPSSAPAVTPAAAQPATAAPTAAPVNAAASAPSVTPAAEPASAAQASSPAQPATAPKLVDNLIGADKPADAAKPADGQKPAEPAKPDEPIKYELKLPEDIKVDEAQMAAVTGILGKAKVAPEIAQELADFHTGALKNAATTFKDAQIEAWNTHIVAQQKEVMADKDIGGNNWDKVKGEIETGLQTFFGVKDGTPENAPERAAHKAFVATLGIGGTGSNIHMLKFIHKAVSRGSEGKPVQGNGPSAPRKSAAELMYPPKQQAAE